eukprot:5684459-Pyramimonas_sp.AAC.4
MRTANQSGVSCSNSAQKKTRRTCQRIIAPRECVGGSVGFETATTIGPVHFGTVHTRFHGGSVPACVSEIPREIPRRSVSKSCVTDAPVH